MTDTAWIPLSDLIPFPGNPRRIDKRTMERLQKSIREFSDTVDGPKIDGEYHRLADPIVVNKQTMRIVGGNQRVKALTAMGQTVIHPDDVRWVDIGDDGREAALNVALNRITGEWDDGLLVKMLEGLDDDLRALAGFEEDDLAAVVARMEEADRAAHDGDGGGVGGHVTEGNTDPDDVPGTPAEPITRPGDVWLLGAFYECEDCGKRYEYEAGKAMVEAGEGCGCDR
jgi:hypothetical protein